MSSVKKAHYAGSVIVLLLFGLQTCMLGQEAKFQQQDDENGLVCLEAENYSEYIEPSTGYWELVEEPENFSGTGAMQALPAGFNDLKDLATGQSSAPILQYKVNFVKVDSVYVWIRSSHLDGYDDSVWIGFNGVIIGTAPITYTNAEQVYANEWHWINHWMGDEVNPARIEIPNSGVLVFEVYMREPSYKMDKILLTTNRDYVPEDAGPVETLAGDTGVAAGAFAAPDGFALAQNYPNPFNPTTTIEFSLPKRSDVQMLLVNLSGQVVKELAAGSFAAGTHQVQLDASSLAGGVYFYRLQAGNRLEVKKLVLAK